MPGSPLSPKRISVGVPPPFSSLPLLQLSQAPLCRTPFVQRTVQPSSGKTVIQQGLTSGRFPRGHTQNRRYSQDGDPGRWHGELGPGTEGAPQPQAVPWTGPPFLAGRELMDRWVCWGQMGKSFLYRESWSRSGDFSGGRRAGRLTAAFPRPHPSVFLSDSDTSDDNDGH